MRKGEEGGGWQQVKGGAGEEASKGGQLGQEKQIFQAVQAQLAQHCGDSVKEA